MLRNAQANVVIITHDGKVAEKPQMIRIEKM